MGQYLPVLVMIVLGLGFAVSSLVMSRLVSTKRPSAAKSSQYESGIVPRMDRPARFPVQFYLVAMVFIVVDVELIFLYPYAIVHRELGAFGLVEIVIFSLPVFAAFVYIIANGALTWEPQRRSQTPAALVSHTRTAETTIRRVGTEGRDLAPADAGSNL